MKIIVKSEKFRLWLWFPLSLLKTKMIRRGFCEKVLSGNGGNEKSTKHDNDDENSTFAQCDLAQADDKQQEDRLAESVVVEKPAETVAEVPDNPDYVKASVKLGDSKASDKLDDGLQVVLDGLDENAIDEQLKAQFNQAYAILKQYVKQNGHFTLLEVNTADKKTYVKIKI